MPDDLEHLGPVAFRRFSFAKACEEDVGHSHNFDHVTIVNAGSVRVFYGDGEHESHHEDYRAGDFFLCEAGLHHRIKSLEPNTRYTCMFSHRDADGIVTQTYSSEAAYH